MINDKDKELINLFRVIREHPEELERVLRYEFVCRDKFELYKKIDTNYLTDIQCAIICI